MDHSRRKDIMLVDQKHFSLMKCRVMSTSLQITWAMKWSLQNKQNEAVLKLIQQPNRSLNPTSLFTLGSSLPRKKINKCSSFALLPFGRLQPHYFTFLNSHKRQPKAFLSRRKQTTNTFICSLFFLTVPRQPLAPLDWWLL